MSYYLNCAKHGDCVTLCLCVCHSQRCAKTNRRISREWRQKIESWLQANEQDDKQGAGEDHKRRARRLTGNRRSFENDSGMPFLYESLYSYFIVNHETNLRRTKFQKN